PSPLPCRREEVSKGGWWEPWEPRLGCGSSFFPVFFLVRAFFVARFPRFPRQEGPLPPGHPAHLLGGVPGGRRGVRGLCWALGTGPQNRLDLLSRQGLTGFPRGGNLWEPAGTPGANRRVRPGLPPRPPGERRWPASPCRGWPRAWTG